jgi:hypothetical protein
MTFTYAPELAKQMRRERSRRRMVWLICASFVWLLAIVVFISDPNWIAPLVAIGFSVLFLLFEWHMSKFGDRTIALLDTHVTYDGRLLRQIDSAGVTVAEIDTADPFDAAYDRHVLGNAIYTVSQPGRADQIRFSSRIDGAERLALEVLKLNEWPPGQNDD